MIRASRSLEDRDRLAHPPTTSPDEPNPHVLVELPRDWDLSFDRRRADQRGHPGGLASPRRRTSTSGRRSATSWARCKPTRWRHRERRRGGRATPPRAFRAAHGVASHCCRDPPAEFRGGRARVRATRGTTRLRRGRPAELEQTGTAECDIRERQERGPLVTRGRQRRCTSHGGGRAGGFHSVGVASGAAPSPPES